MPDEAEHGDILAAAPKLSFTDGPSSPPEGERTSLCVRPEGTERTDGIESDGDPDAPTGRLALTPIATVFRPSNRLLGSGDAANETPICQVSLVVIAGLMRD